MLCKFQQNSSCWTSPQRDLYRSVFNNLHTQIYRQTHVHIILIPLVYRQLFQSVISIVLHLCTNPCKKWGFRAPSNHFLSESQLITSLQDYDCEPNSSKTLLNSVVLEKMLFSQLLSLIAINTFTPYNPSHWTYGSLVLLRCMIFVPPAWTYDYSLRLDWLTVPNIKTRLGLKWEMLQSIWLEKSSVLVSFLF